MLTLKRFLQGEEMNPRNLAVTFAVLYGSCNFLQAVFTTPVEYSNFMWYVMRFFPASYAPKFDPVTMFSRDEVLEIFRQRKIDAEKGKISKVKGFLIWNSTYPVNCLGIWSTIHENIAVGDN
nr:Hypothetical protein CBG02205 [Haemonchus contortus]